MKEKEKRGGVRGRDGEEEKELKNPDMEDDKGTDKNKTEDRTAEVEEL